jgi:hypothetical protein
MGVYRLQVYRVLMYQMRFAETASLDLSQSETSQKRS